jgi:tetratricopeptide (TPR) repeat protein
MILSYYQLQQYPQFLRQGQAFIREFAQHPLSVSLLLQIAEYYQEQKRPEDAIQTYTYLLQTYPQSASVDKALLRLGEIYTASGQPQQALVTYERLLRDGRTADLKPDALLGQGRAYEVMGDIPAALQRYTRIAEQFPENVLAARGLFAAGRLLLTQQKYQEAEHYFEQVVTQYSADALRYDSLLQWGIAELQMQRPEHAITLLQQAQQAPEPRVAAQVQLQLGHAYTLLGNLQESSNAYLRLVYLYPDEESLVTQALRQVAKNYVKLGMCSEASTVYNKLLKRTTAAQETQDLQQEMKRSGCS